MTIIKLHKKIFITITLQLFIALVATNAHSQIDMNTLGGLAQTLNSSVSDERTQGVPNSTLYRAL